MLQEKSIERVREDGDDKPIKNKNQEPMLQESYKNAQQKNRQAQMWK